MKNPPAEQLHLGQLIQRLQLKKNFAYKVLTEKQANLLNKNQKWCQNQLNQELLALFRSRVGMCASLVLGFTKQNDVVGCLSPVSEKVSYSITKLGRKLYEIPKNITSYDQPKLKQCTLLFLSTQNTSEQPHPSLLFKILLLCKSSPINLVLDQSLLNEGCPQHLWPKFGTSNFAVVRQMTGKLGLDHIIKYLCIFTNTAMKKKWFDHSSKIVKANSGDLAIELMHMTYDPIVGNEQIQKYHISQEIAISTAGICKSKL